MAPLDKPGHLRAIAPADDDATLVQRAQGGDTVAFGALYRRHARYVAGVVFRVMGNDADLDDIVQESFLAASDQLPGLREGDRFRYWIARIAVRRAQRRLGKRHRRQLLRRYYRVGTSGDVSPGDREMAQDLYEALDRLGSKLRVPWTLYRIQGEELTTVAEICSLSLATVKRRIKKADELLERRLHAE